MGFLQRLMGGFEESALDVKVREKTRELHENSERLTRDAQQKLSTVPDALDKAIDEDRTKQDLRLSGGIAASEVEARVESGPPAMRADVKEIKKDVKDIKKKVDK